MTAHHQEGAAQEDVLTEAERTGFHNGAVWQAPNKVRIILTYLKDDLWALMDERGMR